MYISRRKYEVVLAVAKLTSQVVLGGCYGVARWLLGYSAGC